jgi:glycosyltransferase involved in cell wall biosynthesis
MPTPREHIYLASGTWDGLWIIQQPVCNEIQKEEPVLFVERPVSIFTALRYPRLWTRLFAWLKGARQVTPNLRVLAPLPLFHLGHRFPRLFRMEFAIQRRWISYWAPRAEGQARVLWLDNPLYACAIGRMGEAIAVYHVGDEVAEFETSHRETMRTLEDQTLHRVGVVFAAADELARARLPRNPNTHAIQNGIDASAYSAEVPAEEFAEIDRLPTPRVGFIGVVGTWVDVPLLAATARALREVCFVIVGPTPVNVAALRSMPNVHFLGLRPRRLIPGILRRLSASLVPFVPSDLTARIVPAKVFEALAAGIVPVCTGFTRNLDSLERQGLVLIARSQTEYIEQVRRAVQEDTLQRRTELERFGLRQTWADRWREMREVLAKAPAWGARPANIR